MRTPSWVAAALQLAAWQVAAETNSTYTNPMLPGWNSDPSCVFVTEGAYNDTWFCTTSSFLTFPNIPIYASKDLQTWRLVSHAYNRVDQFPDIATTYPLQFDGTWASTLRYHKGAFYIITAFVTIAQFNPHLLLFRTTDPYTDESWSDPWEVPNPTYGADPDIFFDDASDLAYVTVANGTGPWSITQYQIDLPTQEVLGEPAVLWNGNGESSPEGPHIYLKDGYHWLLVANGGTQLNHSIAMLRSETIDGQYEFYEGNPVLTNRGTDEYYQTVGHGDLFQDRNGKWWGVALATRSGPEWAVYPMGRESVLYPVTWDENEWPTFQPVRGVMSGWELPTAELSPPGEGPIVNASQTLRFGPGMQIPKNFVTWRAQNETFDNFAISAVGHENTLRLLPSRANLTADASFIPGQEGQSFIARKGQSHTLFEFSVDLVEFNPSAHGEEAGITAFLSQGQHFDLSVIAVTSNSTSSCSGKAKIVKYLQFRAEAYWVSTSFDTTVPETFRLLLPESWDRVRLTITTVNDTYYEFTASSSTSPVDSVKLGTGPAAMLSGGGGMYTGTLLGVFATTNGGASSGAPAYFSNWSYTPIAQEVDKGLYVYY
ncbi:hypothetical protein TruAng_008888 [Truncatella angustata]|nr:hypothetical protein TruAng_008888 [Truncatella angustata]